MKYVLILCLVMMVMGLGGMIPGCPGNSAHGGRAFPITCQPSFTTPASSSAAFPVRFSEMLPAFFGAYLLFGLITYNLIGLRAPAARLAAARPHTPPPRFS
jgi:hypothetical protein